MDTRTQEIDRFKTEINLSEYAASVGYEIDKTESSQRSVVMRRLADKIAVARGNNGHYIYYSFRDEKDNGTIIDFIQNRDQRLNLGEIRKELRPWAGIGPGTRPTPSIKYYSKVIETTEKDRQVVLVEFSKQQEIEGENRYLTHERKIPASVYLGERFKGKIYTDKYRNAVFPHYDDKGLCGFEKKNIKYTGFPKGGTKTIWISNFKKDDDEMIIVESGIEALSHYTLFKTDRSRYVSMSGSWSETAMKIIKGMVDNFNGKITTGFNNDAAGWQLEERFREALEGRRLESTYPEEVGHDWNDMLKASIG